MNAAIPSKDSSPNHYSGIGLMITELLVVQRDLDKGHAKSEMDVFKQLGRPDGRKSQLPPRDQVL